MDASSTLQTSTQKLDSKQNVLICSLIKLSWSKMHTWIWDENSSLFTADQKQYLRVWACIVPKIYFSSGSWQHIVWQCYKENKINHVFSSQQAWQVSKTPSSFLRLVHKMACLMKCVVRLSGIVRKWTNPTEARKSESKNGIILHTWKDNMNSFQENARR